MKKLNYIIITLLLMMCFEIKVKAQTLTGYFMNYTTNSCNYNPVFNPKAKFYLTINDIDLSIGNSAISIKNLVKKINKDKYVIDLDKIYGNLKNRNYLFLNQNISLLNFGFRVGEGYVNGGFSIKSINYITYPKDIMKIKDGTYFGENSTIDLSGIGIKSSLYYEYRLGYSWEFSDKISFGANLKRLQSIANIRTKKSDIKLSTLEDMYDIELKTNIITEFSCGADVKFAYDDKGLLDSIYADNINFDDMDKDDWKKLRKPKNGGWAADLGMTYKLNDKISFASSITDLGFIRYKNNAVKLTQSGTFKFEGVDIAQYFNNVDTIGEILGDSILAYATPQDGNGGYTEMLNTKIYISGMYKLNKNIEIGGLFRGMFYSKRFHPSWTTSLNFRLGNCTQISFSQSFVNRKANVFGFGINQKVGCLQTYVIVDQFSPIFWSINNSKTADKWIKNTNMFNIQFGLCLIFGRKHYTETGYYDY